MKVNYIIILSWLAGTVLLDNIACSVLLLGDTACYETLYVHYVAIMLLGYIVCSVILQEDIEYSVLLLGDIVCSIVLLGDIVFISCVATWTH